MANANRATRAYGINNPLQKVFPGPIVSQARDPLTTDRAQIGSLWINSTSNVAFVLTSIVANVSTWIQISNGAAGVEELTGNSGTASPVGGNINILGAQGIEFTGASDNITLSFDTLDLPETAADLSAGVLRINGNPVLSTLQGVGGGANLWLGQNIGAYPPGILGAARNIAIGNAVLNSLTTGSENLCIGNGTSTSLGEATGTAITTGGSNVLLGNGTGLSITTGQQNIMIGTNVAGLGSLTGSASNNIYIGSGITPDSGDNNVTRIGNDSTTSCFIRGIAGVTVSNDDPVLIDTTTGELGTVSSTRRLKKDIKDMGSASKSIYDLRPVMFKWKDERHTAQQYGLIAEEVAEVMPDFVGLDAEGLPKSVKYQNLPVMLLNEIQKLRAEVDELKKAARK